jgi:hypothetical protein
MTYFDRDGCAYDYPGDAFASADPPPYPTEWTPEERVGAYWYALNYGITVRSTASWKAVLADAQRTAQRHEPLKAARKASDDRRV